MEELESYSVQVEEFTTFGELTDLSKYLKKAQALNAKLELAMEKVHSCLEIYEREKTQVHSESPL